MIIAAVIWVKGPGVIIEEEWNVRAFKNVAYRAQTVSIHGGSFIVHFAPRLVYFNGAALRKNGFCPI